MGREGPLTKSQTPTQGGKGPDALFCYDSAPQRQEKQGCELSGPTLATLWQLIGCLSLQSMAYNTGKPGTVSHTSQISDPKSTL